MRRDAGVVERGGLENRCGCKPTQGSNPCLSRIDQTSVMFYFCSQRLNFAIRKYRGSYLLLDAVLTAPQICSAGAFFIPSRH